MDYELWIMNYGLWSPLTLRRQVGAGNVGRDSCSFTSRRHVGEQGDCFEMASRRNVGVRLQ